MFSLQLRALGKVCLRHGRGFAVSYASRRRKRAIRRNQKQNAASEQFIAFVVQKSKGREGRRPDPRERSILIDAPVGEVVPLSPSTPLRDERRAA